MTAPAPLRPGLLACALALWCGAASAHDTWLRLAQEQPGEGLVALSLGSGARYPRSEESVPATQVAAAGCVDASGALRPLAARQQQPQALLLRTRADAAGGVACWLELRERAVTLPPDLVETYLHDIRAAQAVRDAWARQRQAGLPWQEVYRKYVRIETAAAGDAGSLQALRQPRQMELELLPVGGERLRSGRSVAFQVLRRGQPVAGLAVEFVSPRSPLGIWRHSDAQGRVEATLPFGGEWLLRATALSAPGQADQPWRSAFATLTVQVQ